MEGVLETGNPIYVAEYYPGSRYSWEAEGGCYCYGDFGVCMSFTIMEALKEEAANEKDIMGGVDQGMAKCFSTGVLVKTT